MIVKILVASYYFIVDNLVTLSVPFHKHFYSIIDSIRSLLPRSDNSDPMLGFFSEPIKIYFLIWSVAHFTSRYRRLCGSNGGHGCWFRVDQLICRFSTFFLKMLVQYQACRLLKSSITGKHLFVSKQVWKSCCVENIICWTRAFGIPFF